MRLSQLGDRVLDLLVRRGDAGACVPNVGEGCHKTTTTCGGHVLRENRYRGTITCAGPCGNLELISSEPIGKC